MSLIINTLKDSSIISDDNLLQPLLSYITQSKKIKIKDVYEHIIFADDFNEIIDDIEFGSKLKK